MISGEGAVGFVFDLAGLVGQFHHADRHGHAGVLEQQQRAAHQRRDGNAHGLRHDHEAHALQIAGAQRPGRFELRARDGAQPAADVFGDVGSRAQRQRARRQRPLGVVLVQPHAKALGQQFRHAEVPEQHLHQQRHVAVVFHVGIDHPAARRQVGGAHHDQCHRDREGHHPGNEEQLHGDQRAAGRQLVLGSVK
ncbi:hypothetical protein G6F57_020715 [Rhizopus arrhizus]|nr:hypothetical protein G6F57_020715 [Rhizopus arrhizus]